LNYDFFDFMNTMIIWMLQHTVSGDNRKSPEGTTLY
jgi:hypothetical protein